MKTTFAASAAAFPAARPPATRPTWRSSPPRARRRAGAGCGARGFSLMEVLVAGFIATVAVLGLAYTFGLGRALVDRFELSRMILGVVQARMETLSVLPAGAPELAIGAHENSVTILGVPVLEQWRIEWFDDPATPSTANDLKRATVVARWGRGTDRDSVRLTRLFEK